MTYEKTKLDQSKKRAEWIRDLFKKNELTINNSSYLGKLLISIENIETDKVTESQTINILDLNRLYSALIVMEWQEVDKSILKRLRKGKLDFNDPKNDDGKNILFELEIAALFIEKGIRVKFDEPDLIIEFEGKEIGIACKKVNSIKGLDKAIKKGMKQNKTSNVDYAVVAINIDNYHPVGHILCKETKERAMDFVHERNEAFYKKQARHINKYLKENSLQSLFIDSRIKTDITKESPRFNNLNATSAIQSNYDQIINNKIKVLLGN
ncbi:MAG: hypothetical protein WBF48_10570 [Halarcobacter sp.]